MVAIMRYYINGWCEGRRYFWSFGWTEEEMERMIGGETITKNGNEFRIETAED